MYNDTYFKYVLDISDRAITLELNRVPIFEARYSNIFHWCTHVILVKGTGKIICTNSDIEGTILVVKRRPSQEQLKIT